MRKGNVAGLALEVAGLIALALSPFIVYAGWKAAQGDEPIPWPSSAVVADVSNGSLRGFALVHLDGDGGARIVRWPAETLLNVPRVGELRGESAFRIGGAELIAEGVGGALGIEVPYAAAGRALLPGGIPNEFSSNLGDHADELRVLIADAAPPLDAPGAWKTAGGSRTFVTDWTQVGRYLEGLPVVTPTASPAARTTVKAAALKAITVEVLNAGAPKGGATDAAAALRKAGFTVTRVANFVGRPVKGTIVYFKDKVAKNGTLVAQALKVKKAAALPASFKTKALVLVLVGGP